MDVAKSVMDESRKLIKPIEKLLNRLKMRKNQGLDRNSYDIDLLLTVLDNIKELTEVDLYSNMRKFIPMIDKNGENKLEKTIENVE